MLTQHQNYFYRKIVAAKLFIDEHYAERIDVGNISSEVGFSKYDFIRQFHKTYGTTPHQYLIKVRLGNAAQLLESSDLKVIDVCSRVGFSSPSSFSALFRSTYGQSPSLYRQECLRRQHEFASQPESCIPCCFIPRSARS